MKVIVFEADKWLTLSDFLERRVYAIRQTFGEVDRFRGPAKYILPLDGNEDIAKVEPENSDNVRRYIAEQEEV